MHKKFSKWYSTQILHALENACEPMNAKVSVKLTNMKPLHARWLSEFYNYINSSDGHEITRNGCLRAGNTNAVKMGSLKLPSRDSFLDICSDIDSAVNENLSHVEFTCAKLVDLNHVPRTLIQSLILIRKKETSTTMEMHLTFLKIKYNFNFLVLLTFDICFIYFLSRFFCFLKSIPKLQFQDFWFTPRFLCLNWFLKFWIG